MMKIAGGSPTPNQMIANGIHAIGDSDRKKLIHGSSASRARTWRPTTSPSGTAVTTAVIKPQATRNSEATMSSPSRPDAISSPNATATAGGDGTVPAGNSPAAWAVHQTARMTRPVMTGSTNRDKGSCILPRDQCVNSSIMFASDVTVARRGRARRSSTVAR